MQDEVTASKLKPVLGKRVEILAFGTSYVGTITKVDVKSGMVRLDDGEDYVLLEIERIDHFKVLGRESPSNRPRSSRGR